MNLLPNKLVKLRKHYGYSQDHVASYLGVDVFEYMSFENGAKMINYNQCRKLAALYNVEIIEIFKNSDDIELKEISSTTDELNIEYFTKKKSFFKRHPLIIAVIIGIVIGVGAHFALDYFVLDKEVSLSIDNLNRISASSTTLVYIEGNGAVKGSGDNSNSQISSLMSSDAVSVKEGSDFTIVLKSDGTLKSYGFGSSNEEELNTWAGIVEIAVGENHVVGLDKNGKLYCTGDNTKNQCELKNFKNIKHIYATANGTVGIDEDDNIYYTSEVTGVSRLMNAKGLKDLDYDGDNFIYINSDGTCDYYAENDMTAFYKIDGWKDITDVAAGKDFFAGLKSDGTVSIAIDDDDIKEEVSGWTNIIAIAAADNYLVGYDGTNIYGVGNNGYNQFVSKDKELETLDQVRNISVDIKEDGVTVTFDGSDNASAYDIKLLKDNALLKDIVTRETSCIFTNDLFESDGKYMVTIYAVGNENYLNSKEQSHEFDYELVEDDDEDIEIRTGLMGMTRTDFEDYLNELDITSRNASVDPSVECTSSLETITEFDGITEGRSYSQSALDRTTVNYKYCKLKTESEGTTND